MKYEKEINKLLFNILHEDWMSDDDYQGIVKTAFEFLDTTKEKMSEQIEIGINNGHSVDYQMQLCKDLLKHVIDG